MSPHKHFEDELRALKEQLLTMGSLAEKALDRAVAALVERDAAKLPEVHELERKVNALEIEIDDRSFALLVRRQPVASDLRFIVMSIRISGEIERISDLAVNIANSTDRLLKEPPLKRHTVIPALAELAAKNFRESLDAFVRSDAALARRVIAADDPVDQMRDDQIRTLLTYMMEDPQTISRAVSFMLISGNLERVADHAANIAEEVIYMVEARDIRHGVATGRVVGHGEPLGATGEAPPPHLPGRESER